MYARILGRIKQVCVQLITDSIALVLFPVKRLEAEEEAETDLQEALEEEETGEEFVIKSLEDIQREKALQSMKQNRLKKKKAVATAGSEPKPVVVQPSEPKQERTQPRVEPKQPAATRKRVLTTRRTGKQEIQVYRPPGAKLKGKLCENCSQNGHSQYRESYVAF